MKPLTEHHRSQTITGRRMSPKLKNSVRFHPIDESTFHVYDGTTARHFKMGADEVSWLRLLDGCTPIERLDELIPTEYRDDFYKYVEKMDLVEGKKRKRDLNPLKFKIAKFDPSPLLDLTSKYAVGYRKFLGATAIPIAFINLILGSAASPSATTSLQMIGFTPTTVLLYVVAIALTGLIHELSHALVARSYGVKVPAIGLMLFLVQPTFYADVSAVSLLSSRKERIAVLLAGIKSNNVLLLISLVGFMLFRSSEIAPYLLAFASMNFVLMVINLIPFVEFDGYYVFQELVGEPNFSRHATINVLAGTARKADYAIYFAISQLTRISLICLALVVVRSLFLRIWSAPYIDYVFLAAMLAVCPVLLIRGMCREG